MKTEHKSTTKKHMENIPYSLQAYTVRRILLKTNSERRRRTPCDDVKNADEERTLKHLVHCIGAPRPFCLEAFLKFWHCQGAVFCGVNDLPWQGPLPRIFFWFWISKWRFMVHSWCNFFAVQLNLWGGEKIPPPRFLFFGGGGNRPPPPPLDRRHCRFLLVTTNPSQ